MKSWKTTISGAVTAITAFIVFSPQLFAHWPVAIEVAKFVAAGGLAAIGLSAKDSNVTGGTKLNTEPASDAEQLKASAQKASQ